MSKLKTLLVLGGLLCLSAGCVGAFGFAMMEQDFTQGGLREWLFVKGTLLEKFVREAKPEGTLFYSADPADGPAPESNAVAYASPKPPDAVLADLQAICGKLGLAIDVNPLKGEADRIIECEGGEGKARISVSPWQEGSRVAILMWYPD